METDGKAAPVRAIARHRIEIKVSDSQKDLIARAAEVKGKGLSDFVRSAAEEAAKAALAKNTNG